MTMITTNLCWQDDERRCHQDDHEELAGPDVGREVAVADRREGDDHVPERVEEVKLCVTGALQVLDAAHADHTQMSTINAYRGIDKMLKDHQISNL